MLNADTYIRLNAYLAISLDATGLIRFSAFWVLKKGGEVGHRLYFFLYTFFFFLGSFIGNVSNIRILSMVDRNILFTPPGYRILLFSRELRSLHTSPV